MYEDSKGISSIDRSPNISEENPQASSTDVDKNNTSHQSPQEFKKQEFKKQQSQDPKILRQHALNLLDGDEEIDQIVSLILVDTTLRCFLQIMSNQQDDKTLQLKEKAKFKLRLLKKIESYFQQVRTPRSKKQTEQETEQEIENKGTKYSDVQFFLSLYDILVGSFSHLFLNKDIRLIFDESTEQDLRFIMNLQVHSYLEKMYIDIHEYKRSYMESKRVYIRDEYTQQNHNCDLSQMIDLSGYLERSIRQDTEQPVEQDIKKSEKREKSAKENSHIESSTVIEALSWLVDNSIDSSLLIYEENKNIEKENTEKENTKNQNMMQIYTVILQAYRDEVNFLYSALSFWDGQAEIMGYTLTAMMTVQAEGFLSFDMCNSLDKQRKRPLLCNFLLHMTKNTIKKDAHLKRSEQVKQEIKFGPKNLYISLLSFRDGFYNHLRLGYEAFIRDVESIIKEVIQGLTSEYITSLSSIHSQQLNEIQFGSTVEKLSDRVLSEKIKTDKRLTCSIQSHSIFPFTMEIQEFLVNSSYLFDPTCWTSDILEIPVENLEGQYQEHNRVNSLRFEPSIYTRESICQSIKRVLQTKIQNVMEKRTKRSPKKIIQSSSKKASSNVLSKNNFKKKKLKKGLHRLRYRKHKKISPFSNGVLKTSLKQFDTLLEACSYIKISVSEIHQFISKSYMRDQVSVFHKKFIPSNNNQPPTNKYHYEEEPLLEVVLTTRWEVTSEQKNSDKGIQEREIQGRKIQEKRFSIEEKKKIRCIFSSMKNPISLGNFSCLYEKALDMVHHRSALFIGASGEKHLCDSYSILFHVNHMNMYIDDRAIWKKILYGPFEERSLFGEYRSVHSRFPKIEGTTLQKKLVTAFESHCSYTLQKMDINRFEGWFQHYFNATSFGLVVEGKDGLLLYENPFSTWVLPESIVVSDVMSKNIPISNPSHKNFTQNNQVPQDNNKEILESSSFSKIRTSFVGGGYIYDLKENVLLFIFKK